MSAKRPATTDLNHDNWDQEDPAEKEEAGSFKMASKEVLEKRVIRTAKRRSQATGEEKSVFSGFSGFNKAPKSSMDFLANLTNGSKSDIDLSAPKTDATAVSSSSMVTKPAGSLSGGLFSVSGTSTPNMRSVFGQTTTAVGAFGQTTTAVGAFGSTVTAPIFTQSLSNSSTPTVSSSSITMKPSFSPSSGLFSVSGASTPITKPLFGQTTSASGTFGNTATDPILTQSFSNPSKPTVSSSSMTTKPAFSPSAGLFSVSRASTPNSKSLFGQTTTASGTFDSTATGPILSQSFSNSSQPAVSSSSMVAKPASSPSGGLFSVSGTSPPNTKSVFGQTTTASITFSSAATAPIFTQSPFNSSKPDSTSNDNPFKQQLSANSTSISFNLKSSPIPDKSSSQVSSTLFGIPPVGSNNTSPFQIKSNASTPFKMPVTNSPKANEDKSLTKSSVKDENKLVYYNNLKGLNESVSSWIKKHVEESPLCILTPIFRDYEKHLKNIQDKYEKSKETAEQSTSETKNHIEAKSPVQTSSGFNTNSNTQNSLFSTNVTTSSSIEKTNNFTFSVNTATTTSADNFLTTTTMSPNNFSTTTTTSANNFLTTTTMSPNNFSTTTTTSANNILTTTTISANSFSTATAPPSTGFTFGIKPSTTNVSPFSMTPNTSEKPSFSFGIGKPFAFSSNIQKTDEAPKETENNEDEPPKVEYTPIVEENCVYDKKCKVFVKKDNTFTDKGVATLYIKKIEESGKHQLLVRANTTLGTVLINLILSSSIPTQRIGKNNVMLICIPTPDAQPPPAPMLIRVKTAEEADELLETLNKFKA